MSGRAPSGAAALSTLKKRADFLATGRGSRQTRDGFVLQARARRPEEAGAAARVGFTCSKKVGNAVARNRAKRRLRAAAREVAPSHALPGWDYVLIGRREVTAALPFARLCDDLASALDAAHRRRAAP